ncbi:hypothetical protein FHR84_003157 [Actinopolyspora biskrensis]|uniref:Uncharacterized protein n=1 Tax=Actinopolyspora biskrensis TaxID=1470178 RepID=A0A852Z232_9ACTN|nr:hypothetical protein [Actinopolyspora biskrensis]NYH79819.1 hypothetical protein [Actinopolyspora biskrensis]
MTKTRLNRHTVYWFTPEGEWTQHATLSQPQRKAARSTRSAGTPPPEAPPNSGDRMRHTQQFCPDCFDAYLNLTTPTPRWRRTE